MSFKFSDDNLKKAKNILKKYPAHRSKSAVMPFLDLAQRQNNNYISKDVVGYLAEFLNLPEIKIYEVASFYSMYNLKPVGTYLIQVCGTTPCMLRGAKDILKACEEEAMCKLNETSEDSLFTIKEVECLGACVNAPMVQINDDYYEDLDEQIVKRIIRDLKEGKKIKTGSQKNRQCSAPIEGELF